MKYKIHSFLLLCSIIVFQGCVTQSAQSPIPKGWSAIGSAKAEWRAVGNQIVAHTSTGDSILASDKIYGALTLSATVGTTNREASLALRIQDDANAYIVIFVPDGLSWNDGLGGIWFAKRTSGVESHLGHYRGNAFPKLGQQATISVTAVGPSFEISLSGQKVLSVTDPTYNSGRVGLRIYGDASLPCDATFTQVHVR